jgi:hypothetical protein
LLVGTLVSACGAAPSVTRDHDARPDVEAAEASLPPPPPDALWGDGFGPSQHEAVLDARRAVAEQIVSQVASVTEADTSEVAGGPADVSVRTSVRAESAFDHAELIEILAAEPRPGGFVARAWLDRDRTAGVYRDELKDDRERLRAIGPVVERAIAERDASILLSRAQSPGFLLGEQRRKSMILNAIGRPGGAADEDAAARDLEARASALRQHAVLRLTVEGDVPDELRDAAVAEVEGLFTARGCRLSDAFAEIPDDAPAADVVLRLRTRDHDERDLHWRYVGLEVVATDARNGKPLLRWSGLPEIAHGGGRTWPQADQAVARRLREVLGAKAAPFFEAITCR